MALSRWSELQLCRGYGSASLLENVFHRLDLIKNATNQKEKSVWGEKNVKFMWNSHEQKKKETANERIWFEWWGGPRQQKKYFFFH